MITSISHSVLDGNMIKSIDEFIFVIYNFFALKSIIVLSIYEQPKNINSYNFLYNNRSKPTATSALVVN